MTTFPSFAASRNRKRAGGSFRKTLKGNPSLVNSKDPLPRSQCKQKDGWFVTPLGSLDMILEGELSDPFRVDLIPSLKFYFK